MVSFYCYFCHLILCYYGTSALKYLCFEAYNSGVYRRQHHLTRRMRTREREQTKTENTERAVNSEDEEQKRIRTHRDQTRVGKICKEIESESGFFFFVDSRNKKKLTFFISFFILLYSRWWVSSYWNPRNCVLMLMYCVFSCTLPCVMCRGPHG